MSRVSEVKKLVSVLATSMSTTGAREEALERIPYIYYPVQFKKDKAPMQALINSGSEVNTMHLSFAQQVGFPIRPTDVRAQKINSTMLDTHRMVVAAFSVVDKANQVRFFEEIFLVANISSEVILGMPFLTLRDADVDFSGQDLWWKTYSTEEALPTTKRIELVGKKEFPAVAPDPEHETYVIHIASLNSILLVAFLNVHLFRRAQISGLIAEEVSTKISAEYLDFADVFSLDLASELLKYTGINNHAIELIDG